MSSLCRGMSTRNLLKASWIRMSGVLLPISSLILSKNSAAVILPVSRSRNGPDWQNRSRYVSALWRPKLRRCLTALSLSRLMMTPPRSKTIVSKSAKFFILEIVTIIVQNYRFFLMF